MEQPEIKARRAPFLLILGALYAVLAVIFVLFPNELLYLINVGPKVFKVTEAIPEARESFWCLMAGAGMAALSAVCILSAESPKIRGYFLVHLLFNVVCITGFLTLFFNGQRYFAYLIGAVSEMVITFGLLWNEWGRRHRDQSEPVHPIEDAVPAAPEPENDGGPAL